MTAPVIQTFGLTRHFGQQVAVDGLDLTVTSGEIFALLGPNGSGKTTTILMLVGLLRPTAGRASVFGIDPTRDPAAVRRRTAVLTQETLVYDELTALENLRFYAALYGLSGPEAARRITGALTLVGLEPRRHQRVATFSGGLKRRLALARALTMEPDLVILDEPTLGVDVQTRAAIWDHVRSLKAEGKTAILTTNYMEEAEALSDRVAILDQGRLVALGTVEELKDRVGTDIIEVDAQAFPPSALELLGAVPGVEEVAPTGPGRLRLRVREGERVFPLVLDQLGGHGRVRAVSLRRPTLNDTFLALTGRALRE